MSNAPDQWHVMPSFYDRTLYIHPDEEATGLGDRSIAVIPSGRLTHANLIAAAPDLLAALIGFIHEFGDKAENSNVKAARAAIARAGYTQS